MSSGAKKVLSYACEQEEKGGKLGSAINFFTKIYNTSDTFYCTTSGCACQAKLEDFKAGENQTYYQSLTLSTNSGVKSVQYCPDYLEQVYEDLLVDKIFGTLTEETDVDMISEYEDDYPDGPELSKKKGVAKMQRFMNFLGKIEEDNKCSGVCTQKNLYYFSDVSMGVPTTNCKLAFEKQIEKAYGNYGIGCIIIGFLLCVPFLLHIPLLFSCKDCWKDAAFFPTRTMNII